jgi:hypothetical protein
MFGYFHQYHIEILLGDFNAMGRDGICEQTIGKDSSHKDTNDNGVRIVHTAAPKSLIVKEYQVPTPKY